MRADDDEWQALVLEGRRLLRTSSDVRWQLANLMVRVAPVASPHTHTGSYQRLRRWLDEIGWPDSFKTALAYRSTANRWPPGKRNPSVSFSTHLELREHENRFTLIESVHTVRQAREAIGATAKRAHARRSGDEAANDPSIGAVIAMSFDRAIRNGAEPEALLEAVVAVQRLVERAQFLGLPERVYVAAFLAKAEEALVEAVASYATPAASAPRSARNALIPAPHGDLGTSTAA